MQIQDPQTNSAIAAQPRTLYASAARAWTLLLLVFVAVHFAALFSPSLLDDADATHAQAAQHIVSSGDWVTLYVNGIRYLEKPPLPYWLAAIDYHIFGENVFATHLPISLAVLGCAFLAWLWGKRAYGDRAGFYAALAVLTSVGIFLWTRFLIPESLLTLFITLALYCFLTGLEDRKPSRFYAAYAALALALLAKGLIAPVFFGAAIIPYLIITGEWRRWREMRLFTGILLFLAIGAPWHILCGLRNPDQGHPVGNVPTPGNVHGFFYFYFINEHFLRFLGKRYPHDYNKQPWFAYWFGQLVWLFPWSLFLPAVAVRAWRNRRIFSADLRYDATNTIAFLDPKLSAHAASSLAARLRFRARTGLLLGIFAAFILIFFSISTNQEYYTWPAWPAVLILIAGALAMIEEAPDGDARWLNASSRWLTGMHAAFAAIGVLAAAALAYGLWASRNMPFVADIGSLLAHRAVGNYSLATSHFFDLTGPSFAALREPAVIAAIALLIGPLAAWRLRKRGHGLEATTSVAFTLAIVLIAAHIALDRFGPMLSSERMAATINHIAAGPGEHDYQLIIYGDQADASSVIFYTHHQALLAHGNTNYFEPRLGKDGRPREATFGSSMIWGSDYPDAPHIFMADPGLLAKWGAGPRIFLFVPGEFHDHVEQLMADHGKKLYELQELSDKTLYTDRPL
ncbi:MAG TPA: glycosyltransferase family 39 protein [Acidobacteriaceae bacterium]|nr:glycosyltransferase family 39 protein [Acidobacteriaceae bacterium]